jgi:hypothetical protein
VRNLPRTALHRPTSDLGYGLPSLKAHAAQLTVYRLQKIMNTPGYKGHMARAHIRTISTTYTHWLTKSIMPGSSSLPTLRCMVRAQRDTCTMFHNISPVSTLPHQPHCLHTPRPLHPPRQHPPNLTPRQSHPLHRPSHLQTNML